MDHSKQIVAAVGLVFSGWHGYAFAEDMCFLQRHPPVVESSYYHFVDSDKTRIDAWQQAATVPVNEQMSWSADYARSRFAEPGIQTTYENRYATAVAYRQDERSLEVKYGYRDFRDLDASHIYKISGTSPVGPLKNVTLAHEYNHWETAKAIRAKIKAYINSVGIHQPLGQRWISTAYYQNHQLNDHNARDLLRSAILFRVLRNRPELQFGYEYVYYNMKERSRFYWSPDNLRINQLKWVLIGELWGSKLTYALAYAMGFAQQKGEVDQTVHSGLAEVRYNISKRWQFFVSCEMSDDPAYDSALIQGGLRYLF